MAGLICLHLLQSDSNHFHTACLVQLPIIHLELHRSTRSRAWLCFPACFLWVYDSFLCLHRTLYSFLFISKLEAEVVCLHDCTNRGWKDRESSCLKGDSALPSGVKCHIDRPSNCTDIQIFVCSVMFYSSLNFWAFTPGMREECLWWTEDSSDEWGRKRAVNIMRTKDDSSLVSLH